MRALEPARASMRGLKTSRRREHARGVLAPHHSQVTENVGETAPGCTGRLCPGERPMRNFANEGHSAVTEMAQGFKGDGAESVFRTIVVPEVFVVCRKAANLCRVTLLAITSRHMYRVLLSALYMDV
jgi:hypothetical protein